jgi:hypothetical protein
MAPLIFLPLCFDVEALRDAVLILEWSFDHEESAARDDDAILLKDVGREDDVGDAGFVFEREKDEALGGAWALAGDDAACGADKLIGACRFEFLRGENALLASCRADRPWGAGRW